MNRIFVTTFILLSVLYATASAQPFSVVEVGIEPSAFGGISLADFDADGDLDVYLSGSKSFTPTFVGSLYRNDRLPTGDLYFSSVSSDFRAAKNSSEDAGDYDNDGDVDLLVVAGQSVIVYRNDGQAGFTAIPIYTGVDNVLVSFVQDVINAPSCAWGDYDNDGDLDIVFSVPGKTSIFKNEGNDRFVETAIQLPVLVNGSVSWGDFEGDGDLDLLLVSKPFQQPPATYIYRNDRKDTFVEIQTGLPGIKAGSVTWGDYDADGDLDVLLMSTAVPIYGSSAASGIYRNDGGTFVLTPDAFSAGVYADWIDIDGDGKLDVIVNGIKNGNTVLELYQQQENGFVSVASLPGMWFGDIVSGDLDRDGDVDFLLTGRVTTGLTRTPKVLWLRNDSPQPSQLPLTPIPSLSSIQGGTLFMSWYPAVADQESRKGVTYNVRVGSSPGASDILSAHALPDGKRLVVGSGNAGKRLNLSISGLEPVKSYYWSVQAVDHAGNASAFTTPLRVDGYGRTGKGGAAADPSLLDNYPNPFNPQTTIRYLLHEATPVKVAVYNVLGSEIAVLVDNVQEAGIHETIWNGRDAAGRDVPSGLYLYRLVTPQNTLTKTMVLLR